MPAPPGVEATLRGRAIRAIGWAPWALAGLAAALAILVAVLLPNQAMLSAQALVLTLGVSAAWAVLRVSSDATRATGSEFDRALTLPRTGQLYLAELRSIEVALGLALTRAGGSSAWLAPILRDIARWRLQVKRNIDLDAQPDEARRVMGEPLWHLAQPSDERSGRRDAAASIAELDRAVTDLEQI
jgi:hypothetical protein